LLARIKTEVHAQCRAVEQRQRQVEQARQRLAQGEFSLALGLADDLGASVAQQLQQDANLRQRDFQSACQRARQALDWQAWPDAVAGVLDAGRLRPHDDQYAALRHELIAGLQCQLETAMRDGRLDRAQHHLGWLNELGLDNSTLGTSRRVWQECARAVAEIRRADYAAAGRLLRAARQLLGEAAWLDEAIRTLTSMAEGQDQLWGGPLGLVLDASELQQTAAQRSPRLRNGHGLQRPASSQDHYGRGEKDAAAMWDAGFVLHVGSAQSALVVTRPRIKIGPVTRSQPVDIPLVGAGSAATVVIERLEDDYFLRADEPVQVNSQRVTTKLLSHGDKIVLGERAGLLFQLPCPASNSAVLEVVGARLPRADTRHVVLLSDTLVVGPHRQSHLMNSSLPDTLVIQGRSGGLAARVGAEHVSLPWGQTVEVAGLPVTVIPSARTA
jgi:hypothetical protein